LGDTTVRLDRDDHSMDALVLILLGALLAVLARVVQRRLSRSRSGTTT
jgi:hypothetical protein